MLDTVAADRKKTCGVFNGKDTGDRSGISYWNSVGKIAGYSLGYLRCLYDGHLGGHGDVKLQGSRMEEKM